ncbi:MAG: recombination protein O N-terminal domain-containing protein [Acidobacteriota bacterium]|nr:recombination protein O N-terminal domain-containing protein [Acidobacteriota bacterium]
MIHEQHLAYVLGTTTLSTSRTIVRLFTRYAGKRQAVMRRREKRTQAYLAPLTLITCHLRGREHQELMTLEEPELECHRFELSARYTGLALLQHWAHLVDLSHGDGMPDEQVFRLLGHVLDGLGQGERPELFQPANLYLETWMLHFAGVLPRAVPRGPKPESISKHADEQTLHRSLNPDLLRAVFQHPVETYLVLALDLGDFGQTQRALGMLWTRFLGREPKTRKLLEQQFEAGWSAP